MLKKNHLQFLAKIYKRYDGIVDAYTKLTLLMSILHILFDNLTQNERTVPFSKRFDYV